MKSIRFASLLFFSFCFSLAYAQHPPHHVQDDPSEVEPFERKFPKYYNQKIIVVSGCLTAEVTMACMRKGVRHIVVKPFTARQILLKAIQALGIAKKAENFVEQIIGKVTERLMEDRERMANAIADDEVMEMISKAKGE